IMLVSGADDQMWPSPDLADIAVRRLESRGHAYPFRHLEYKGAGHLISVPYGPTTIRSMSLTVEGLTNISLSQGGSARADAEAGADAWRRTLEFLAEAVKQRGR